MMPDFDPTDAARQTGERRVREIAEYVRANEPELRTLIRLERLVRHGAQSVDLFVRVDGCEHGFQADWLARLFREPER